MVIYDRFVPVRSAMDFGAAHSDLTWGAAAGSSSYRRRGRIMAYNDRQTSEREEELGWVGGGKTTTLTLRAERVMSAPGIKDDASINPMDWGAQGQLTVAIEGTVTVVKAVGSEEDADDPYQIETGEEEGEIGCVKWAPDGGRMAIGLENSIKVWDTRGSRVVRTQSVGSRVHSMCWNGNNIISIGGSDGRLVISDTRLKEHTPVGVYHAGGGGRTAICGLSWCSSGPQLASGCGDGLVQVWDARTWHHHPFPSGAAAGDGGARALAWCPFSDGLLATGGGGCIRFWSTGTGTCASTLRTGAGPVHALGWSKSSRQLVSSSSSGGGARACGGVMAIWDYTRMSMTRKLMGHTHRALYLAQSPDGCRIASAAGGTDETVRMWNAFPRMPATPLPVKPLPFTTCYRTHIRMLNVKNDYCM